MNVSRFELSGLLTSTQPGLSQLMNAECLTGVLLIFAMSIRGVTGGFNL